MVAEPTAEEKAPAMYTQNRPEGRASSRPIVNGGAGTFTPDKIEPEKPIGFDTSYLGGK
jgi:hypothetical protein